MCDLLPDDYDPDSGMVGLRADIDGLPIQDGKSVSYRSVFDGCCHACGHDVHTTVVLGTGLVLARLRELGQLQRGVRLIFQPAEELSPGGAVDAIACGVIDGLTEVYAMHCDPRTDAGQLALKTGAITSAVDRVLVTVKGPGGHTSRPQLSGDLIGALGAVATPPNWCCRGGWIRAAECPSCGARSPPDRSRTRSLVSGPWRAPCGRSTRGAGTSPTT